MFRRCLPGARCFGVATNAVPPEFTETITFDEEIETELFRAYFSSEKFFSYRIPAGSQITVQYTEQGFSIRRLSAEERKRYIIENIKVALKTNGEKWNNYYPGIHYSYVDLHTKLNNKLLPDGSTANIIALMSAGRNPQKIAVIYLGPLEVRWFERMFPLREIRELNPDEVRRNILGIRPAPQIQPVFARMPFQANLEENPRAVIPEANNAASDPTEVRNGSAARRRKTARKNRKSSRKTRR